MVEVFKEKKQRESEQRSGGRSEGGYSTQQVRPDLEDFAEKLPAMLPTWLSPSPLRQPDCGRGPRRRRRRPSGPSAGADAGGLLDGVLSRRMEELQARAWAAEEGKEAAWRLRRVGESGGGRRETAEEEKSGGVSRPGISGR
ncbi:uncharacterized protein A4U43_C08F35210 [Asparagus officinalis]|nr:uncharacterized protein A4U43_C08F35210 [Asparagus officinalis]